MTRTIRILHFGDSLTLCGNLPGASHWTSLCHHTAQATLAGSGCSIESTVSAVCGEDSSQALARMPEVVLSQAPSILTIQFGANDSVYWQSMRGAPRVDLETFRANLAAMGELAAQAGVRTIIFRTTHRFDAARIEGNGRTHNENMTPYNEVVRTLCSTGVYVLCDTAELLREHDPASYTAGDGDGVHLNELGCALYAKIISPVLLSAIRTIITEGGGHGPQ